MVILRVLQEEIVAKIEAECYEASLTRSIKSNPSVRLKFFENLVINIRHNILTFNFDDDLLLRLLDIFVFCQNYLNSIKEKLLKHKLSA